MSLKHHLPSIDFNSTSSVAQRNSPDLRENESISVDPVRIRRVEAHEFVEHDMGHWGHAHGRTRVA